MCGAMTTSIQKICLRSRVVLALTNASQSPKCQLTFVDRRTVRFTIEATNLPNFLPHQTSYILEKMSLNYLYCFKSIVLFSIFTVGSSRDGAKS